MIYNVNSVVATRSFIKGLQPGSMLFEDLIKNTPYDMTEIRDRAEGVFRVLESREKLDKKVTAISVENEVSMQNKRSFPHNSQGWNKRQRSGKENYDYQLRQQYRPETPHYDLNTSLERIFMENKNKNIFCPPPKMQIPESMRNKSLYCVHHKDFGHLTNDCRNLYRQVMHTIRKGGLQQYMKRVNGAPKMAEQPGSSAGQKNKGVAEQRALGVEQHLHMVPMITGLALINEEEEKKKKQNKKIEQRVKRLRSLGHTVNYVSTQEEFYPSAPIVFIEQDLQAVRLPH